MPCSLQSPRRADKRLAMTCESFDSAVYPRKTLSLGSPTPSPRAPRSHNNVCLACVALFLTTAALFSERSLTFLPAISHLPRQALLRSHLGQREEQQVPPRSQHESLASEQTQTDVAASAAFVAVAATDQPSNVIQLPKGLAAWLNFSSDTVLNYFHNHKTGGTTLAGRIRQVLEQSPNVKRPTVRGHELCYRTTCGQFEGRINCDIDMLRNLTVVELTRCPIILGHQYFDDGADTLFLAAKAATSRSKPVKRARLSARPLYSLDYSQSPVRHFTTLRHPLSRRLSAYHHFVVRNQNVSERSVTRGDLISFLHRETRTDVRTRFCGPHYYASHLVSDGHEHFDYHAFVAPPTGSMEYAAMKQAAVRRLRSFVLVGLQSQPAATFCMTRRLLQAYARAQGLQRLDGMRHLAQTEERWNSGTYRWTSRKLWQSMGPGERARFRRLETLDYSIYEVARNLFRQHVKVYGCAHLVDEKAWREDVFE